MSLLFEPITLRDLTIKNRVWLPPMCQYSATNGLPHDWHLVHYGARAAGGFGLLIAEATAVVPEGRITPWDLGLWNDEQVTAWTRVTDFAHTQDVKIAVQLAHAGRKGSTGPGPHGEVTLTPDEGGWEAFGPTAEPFPGYAPPTAMSTAQAAAIPGQFAEAATRAVAAGFDAVEIHAAHGYLLHEFLSPLTNTRTDEYGGSAENRARIVLDTVSAVREVIPEGMPLLMRVSATDWTDSGLQVSDVADVLCQARALGVDFADVSTGALVPATIPVGPSYQVPAARQVRDATRLPTGAVGEITQARQAEGILVDGAADVVLIGRAALRDPNWPLHAAHTLRAKVTWPTQLARGAWR
ncbi:MAG: NADH:flavin oxidoreductase/NADH oxidase [Cellulomonadaceae bacterium]|jgi:2,4-dienoyl-CoA reductase-like NADH-dependent reductase (Old Yellow Enzyme family)|nr:NADH:flavin oxidoreductase/NADH oxidase [Cellulomonadaceae bacterium]